MEEESLSGFTFNFQLGIFQFKQFSVEQKQSSAKITTDATVFASVLPIPENAKHVLEIGTGTGVLSLILAQRFPKILIDAVEINYQSFKEAKNNFNNSSWKDRFRIFLIDFKQFESSDKYDVIFSNPPFFQNNLKSKINEGKNIAYHTDLLSFKALAIGISDKLTINGKAYIMLPPFEMSLFEKEMNKIGYYSRCRVELRHQPKTKVIRLFKFFERAAEYIQEDVLKIYIRDENDKFHPSYRKLMQDFLTIF